MPRISAQFRPDSQVRRGAAVPPLNASATPTSLIKVKAARRTSMRAIKRERAGEA